MDHSLFQITKRVEEDPNNLVYELATLNVSFISSY